jgi:hypothetical protein
MRQPHQTPHKNRIIPIFCAVSDAAVASDTVKITVHVNTPLDLQPVHRHRLPPAQLAPPAVGRRHGGARRGGRQLRSPEQLHEPGDHCRRIGRYYSINISYS